ncbi:MAG: 2Fe-2S iron-sulfur cluster-binding protein [Armatimonadota bacterium]|nr:(2Fe-2S)-binding protein [Fimbriimonadaceae bacterium]MCZ8138317.1 2Fe-2S iron-sulfur cluster-binding protein [Fimbriimonadaceae bacterium]
MSQHRLDVVGGGSYVVESGTKLALALEQNGEDVSHRCGGNARCTTCRVTIKGEEPPMGEDERACLEEDGVLGQFRLSCQIRMDRDMEVEILMRASEQGWDPGVEIEP